MKRLAVTLALLCGCSCELGDPPPSTDVPPPPPGCGRLAVPTCWDDCCTISSSPRIDPATCTATCPGTTRAFFDACAPEPSCVDGFDVPGCGLDAGPIPLCMGGPCCDRMEPSFIDPRTCAITCPSGFAIECRPEPVCDDAFRVCDEPSECVVTPNVCCGECAEPTLEGSTAVHRTRESEFRDRLCEDSGACPDCEVRSNPALVATCNAARCAAVDIARLPFAACSADEECMLRTPECCECGASTEPSSLVALRRDGIFDLLGLVCDTGAACDACEPIYPEDVFAGCVDGVCRVLVDTVDP